MTNICMQASSGASGSYLAVQALTSVNYVSPAGGCYIRRIMHSVRTGGGQTFVYYADDATGSNAKIVFHLGNSVAYQQTNLDDLWIPVPPAKYILTYGVGSIHDTTFTVAENVEGSGKVTVSVSSVAVASGYQTFKSSGNNFIGPGKIERVIAMNTATNSLGYLYWADDTAGSYANVMRGYVGNLNLTITDSKEDCMMIPKGKYLLAHAEVGSFSCAVTVAV